MGVGSSCGINACYDEEGRYAEVEFPAGLGVNEYEAVLDSLADEGYEITNEGSMTASSLRDSIKDYPETTAGKVFQTSMNVGVDFVLSPLIRPFETFSRLEREFTSEGRRSDIVRAEGSYISHTVEYVEDENDRCIRVSRQMSVAPREEFLSSLKGAVEDIRRELMPSE